MLCPGQRDGMYNCRSQDYCIQATHEWGWDEATQMPTDCTAFCPVECDWNQVPCFGGYDENGCEMPGWCAASHEDCFPAGK